MTQVCYAVLSQDLPLLPRVGDFDPNKYKFIDKLTSSYFEKGDHRNVSTITGRFTELYIGCQFMNREREGNFVVVLDVGRIGENFSLWVYSACIYEKV